MQPRIPNPALSVPGVIDALQSLGEAVNNAAKQAGLSQTTLDLVSLRASQINGCAVCLDMHVNVHHNFIANNASLGDELFSGTWSGGGGATLCTGSDYYKFNYNWVCGNLSSGEGGGVTHLGFIYSGDIEHNTIVLNQSSNPTIPTNGGGISVQGTPDTDPICGALLDQDCPPGLSDGTGPNLVIDVTPLPLNFSAVPRPTSVR